MNTMTVDEYLRENDLLELINKGRRKRGEPELVWSRPKPELVVDNVVALAPKPDNKGLTV